MVEKICTRCGTTASEDAQFCNQCGSPLAPRKAVPPAQGEQPDQPGQIIPPTPIPQPEQPAPPAQTFTAQTPGGRPQGGVEPEQAPYPPPAGAPHYGAPHGQWTTSGYGAHYEQPAAPGYGAQGPYIPTQSPKKWPNRKIALIVGIGVLALAVVGIIVGIALWGGGAGDMDYYEIGRDRVPSVSHALGEDRRVDSAKPGSGRDMETLTVVYNVSGDGQGDDMGEYFNYLCDKDGFTMMDGAPASGLFRARSASGIQAWRASREDGYLVVVQADYDEKGYTITVMLGEGEPPQSALPDDAPLSPSSTVPTSELPPVPPSSTPASNPPPTTGGNSNGGLLPQEDPVSTNSINGLNIASYADGTVSINDGNVILTPDGRLFIDGEELPNNGSLAVPQGGTRINVNTCQVVLLDGDIYLVANGCVVYIEDGSYAYLYTQE